MQTSGSSNGPNWLGLLQWSLAYQDGTAPSNRSMLSQEDQLWLERALREGVVDEPKRIGEIITLLKSKLEEDDISDSHLCELEELTDITEQIDMAGVCVKLGGLRLIESIITFRGRSVNDAIRLKSLSLAGSLAQNNPEVQIACISRGLLDTIAALVPTSPPGIQNKSLYAISCMIRGLRSAEGYFVKRHMRSVFTSILQRDSSGPGDEATRRVLFLSAALVSSDYATRERIAILADIVVPSCSSAVEQNEDSVLSENALALLRALLAIREGCDALVGCQEKLLKAIQSCQRALQERVRSEVSSADETSYLLDDLSGLAVLEDALAGLGGSDGDGMPARKSIAAIEESIDDPAFAHLTTGTAVPLLLGGTS